MVIATRVWKKLKFDPLVDSKVRIAARTLRGKTTEYYRTEGLHDSIEIRLLNRGYVLEIAGYFHFREIGRIDTMSNFRLFTIIKAGLAMLAQLPAFSFIHGLLTKISGWHQAALAFIGLLVAMVLHGPPRAYPHSNARTDRTADLPPQLNDSPPHVNLRVHPTIVIQAENNGGQVALVNLTINIHLNGLNGGFAADRPSHGQGPAQNRENR
jgi:hypothetical protein